MATFKVRDFRNKGFFLLDDAYLNGYAKLLPISTSVVYFSLCRHADKAQSSFPAQELIAKEHNIDTRTVRRAINTLTKCNIISSEKLRNKKGMWLNNTYYLLDKSVWLTKEEILEKGLGKKPRGHQSPMGIQRTIKTVSRGHQTPTKDTHKKDTHIKKEIYKERKVGVLEDLTPELLEEVAQKYGVSIGLVNYCRERLINYCQSTGKTYKDYKAALRNFVLGEMKKQLDKPVRRGGVVDGTKL